MTVYLAGIFTQTRGNRKPAISVRRVLHLHKGLCHFLVQTVVLFHEILR